MVKQCRSHSNHKPRPLTLPELDQSKNSVLNTLGSLQSRRSYQHAMDEFIAWYCAEPWLALNRNRRPALSHALGEHPLGSRNYEPSPRGGSEACLRGVG